MQNFQNIFETRKRSFITAFSICMTLPLMFLISPVMLSFQILDRGNVIYSSEGKSQVTIPSFLFFRDKLAGEEQRRSSRREFKTRICYAYNPGHNILELYNIFVEIQFTTSKTKLNIQYSKLGIRVTLQVAERLKTQDLRKLGNIKKCQIWMDTQPSAQSPSKNLDFANSS